MNLEVYTDYIERGRAECSRQSAAFGRSESENHAVNLYPELAFETLEGFGGAVTDSAAYVYSRMDEAQKRRLMEAYFSDMGYTLLRVPLDSCDFSLGPFEALSDPADQDLRGFSFEREGKYILPMLRDAQAAAGRPLRLMLSPWSPPAFMKTNGKRTNGGGLKPEFRELWAEYLCRYIREFQERGFAVSRVSLQNEPRAVQTWDSCLYTAAEQREFLKRYMRPAMERHGLTEVGVFLWDHNKERLYEWMREAMDEESAPLVSGAAFHWYSGDHFEALELFRRAFPDKKLILSESCIEFSKFSETDDAGRALRLSHELIGDLNHGATAFYDWNLLLDETGGPNYVGNNCLAPFLYDTIEKKLKPQFLQKHLAHFSRDLLPGSVRIGHSVYTRELDATAWKRPDGRLAVLLLNQSERTLPVCVRMRGLEAAFSLPPRSLSTGLTGA